MAIQQKRTKIVATLGPATDDSAILSEMLEKGVDVVRLNFSHGDEVTFKSRVEVVRQCSAMTGKPVAILADLQGPKIRIARFKEGKVTLKPGDCFVLDASLDHEKGDQHQVGLDYKDLPQDVSKGSILVLDDGLIALEVQKVEQNKVVTNVVQGGDLSDHKGINLKGGGLSAKALTDKDRLDLVLAVTEGCDYLALSFPRDAADLQEARDLVAAEGGACAIIAKIERTEALDNLESIIKASDGIMVARGDLAVEIGDEHVPAAQRQMIQMARALDKPVITATQMMESMVQAAVPTRAEVSDVANAVLESTDAVMLSAESAVGEHPVKVVEAMARVCLASEQDPQTQLSHHRIEETFSRRDEAIAMATMYVANHMDIKGIIALTESGATPLWMSRIRSGIPIYGLSRFDATCRKMMLYRGVHPVYFDVTQVDRMALNQSAIDLLVKLGYLKQGDLVIITKGTHMGEHGGTCTMRIAKVGDPC